MPFDSKSSWFEEKTLLLKGFITKKQQEEGPCKIGLNDFVYSKMNLKNYIVGIQWFEKCKSNFCLAFSLFTIKCLIFGVIKHFNVPIFGMQSLWLRMSTGFSC